jgi:PAS domain S-box-containing protein
VSHRTAQQLDHLFELSLDLLVIIGPDGRVVSANPSWERVLGIPPASLEGTSLLPLIHPDDLDATVAGTQRVREGQRVEFENRYRHADGHWVRLQWSTVVTDADGMVYAAAHDVTEERRAIEEADGAIARLESAQRAAGMGSWELDLRTGRTFFTRQMYVLTGLDPDRDEPWGLRELLEHVPDEDRQALLDVSDRVLREPGRFRVEYRLSHAPECIYEAVLEAEHDADGRAVVVRGTSQDVTEMRRSERRLAEAERLADLGSFEWRVSDGAVVWSDGIYRLFGRDPTLPPLTRQELEQMGRPEEVARAAEVLERFARDHKPWALEFSFPMPAGLGRRIVNCRGEAYRSGEEIYVRGTMQDVTEQRRVERQQHEIARLGQIALAGSDLKELFDDVCRVVTDVLETDAANILALQGDGSLAFASSVGIPGADGTAIAAGQDSIARRALEADAPQVVPDWLTETRYPYSPQLQELGARCSAVVPIRGRDRPFGVLTTHAMVPSLDEHGRDPAFLQALASFLATAIERLRHEAEIGALATLRGRLVAENLEAEERVRQRISEQLHDGALQDLLAARQDLVEAAAAGEDGPREEMLRYAREGVERAVRLLREAVQALHPVVLQHGGLEAAMQAAAGQAARQGGFRAEVTVDPAAAGVRDELVLSLARELLNNAAKHAAADTVQVTVGRQDDEVLLEVSDDGRGLDHEAVAAAPMHGHIGLASLTQRVEAVGGALDLRAGAGGHGTTVLARLPID